MTGTKQGAIEAKRKNGWRQHNSSTGKSKQAAQTDKKSGKYITNKAYRPPGSGSSVVNIADGPRVQCTCNQKHCTSCIIRRGEAETWQSITAESQEAYARHY